MGQKKQTQITDELNAHELAIMNVLWNSKKSMIASEIVEADPSLTIPTVQRLLKKLMEKRYIKVAEIVTSGKVLARSYSAVKKQEDYMKFQIKSYYPDQTHEVDFSKTVVATLLNEAHNDITLISELEDFLNQKKKELEAHTHKD